MMRTLVCLACLLLFACGDDGHTVSPDNDAPPVADGRPPDAGPPADAGVDTISPADDEEPPAIEIVDPDPGQLVGGVVTVVARVTDPNLDSGTIVAVFGNGPMDLAEFPLEASSADEFTGSYDTRELRMIIEGIFGTGVDLVFPTLSVRARDLAGNETSVGEIVTLDYHPPVASLDPPHIREAFLQDGSELICSWKFDPLGDDAVDDGQAVGQLAEFRAQIEDRGNGALAPSGVVLYDAGVNPLSVQLFILDATSEATAPTGDALVVDTDGDGVCDEINPMLSPTTVPMTSSDAVAVNLVPVEEAGSAWYAADTGGYSGWDPDCTGQPPDDPPDPLCLFSSGLQRVIANPLDGSPVIYTIPPLNEFSCEGYPNDSVASNISDGWACVAVRAIDNLGNVGVSRPIRVCFDHDGNGAEGCPALPTYPPRADVTDEATDEPIVPTQNPAIDCTGTYVPASNTTNAALDCTVPPTFPANTVRMLLSP